MTYAIDFGYLSWHNMLISLLLYYNNQLDISHGRGGTQEQVIKFTKSFTRTFSIRQVPGSSVEVRILRIIHELIF